MGTINSHKPEIVWRERINQRRVVEMVDDSNKQCSETKQYFCRYLFIWKEPASLISNIHYISDTNKLRASKAPPKELFLFCMIYQLLTLTTSEKVHSQGALWQT